MLYPICRGAPDPLWAYFPARFIIPSTGELDGATGKQQHTVSPLDGGDGGLPQLTHAADAIMQQHSSPPPVNAPRSRVGPPFHALKPLISPLNVVGDAKGAAGSKTHTGGASGGNGGGGGGGKPIMEWLSRKLGHGKRPLSSGVSTMAGRSAPAVAVTEIPARAPSTDKSTTTTAVHHHQKPKEKPASSSSFVRQASSLGISSRKKQVMANHSTTLEPPPRRRRSSHHASSIKSASARSSRAPLFSPPRSSIVARYPRAATFMTRSSTSPASSFISSRRSRRSPSEETEHSLAGSYLDVDDPDSRSFVPSASADEDASLRPFPPSLYPSSPSHQRASSIDSGSGRYSRNSIDGLASLRGDPAGNPNTYTTTGNNNDVPSDSELSPSGFPLRRASQSTIATTQSSFGAQSRTWTSDLSRGARSVDTRPTTILSSLDLPRVAHIAQVPPPRVPPQQNRPSFVVPAGNSGSSNASALAPAASILDGAPHRRAPSGGSFPLSLGMIHRVDSGLSTSPSVSSPLATGAVFTRPRDVSREDDEDEEDDVRDVTRTVAMLEPETCRFTASMLDPVSATTRVTDDSYPCHVPHHSHRHPRDNPRPLSPPNENASLLTLASSTFTDAATVDRYRRRSAERSSIVGGTSLSANGGSTYAGREARMDHPVPLASSSVAVFRDIMLTPTDHDGFPSPDATYSRGGGAGEEDEADEYDDHQTPVIIGGMYNERDGGSFRFGGGGSGSHYRPPSYFDRGSSYYFNPLGGGGGGGAGSVRASVGGGGGVAGSWMDDRASVTAMRRRGSWESGESSFSWVGAGALPTAAAVGLGSGPLPLPMTMPAPPVLGRDLVSTTQQPQHAPVTEQDGVAAARSIESPRTDSEGPGHVGMETGLATSLDRLNVHEEQARG